MVRRWPARARAAAAVRVAAARAANYGGRRGGEGGKRRKVRKTKRSMETFEIFWNKEIGPVFSYGRKRVGDEDEAKSACSPRIRPALSFSSPIKDDHQQKRSPKKSSIVPLSDGWWKGARTQAHLYPIAIDSDPIRVCPTRQCYFRPGLSVVGRRTNASAPLGAPPAAADRLRPLISRADDAARIVRVGRSGNAPPPGLEKQAHHLEGSRGTADFSRCKTVCR